MKYRLAAYVACGLSLFSAACLRAEFAEPQVTQIGDHLHFAGESVRLSTTSNGQQAVVAGHVGDRGPFRFVVDTGSGVNVIDRVLAREMGLKKVGEKEVLSGGVEPVTADVVLVPLVRVDGLTIQNAEFLTLDLDAMSLGTIQGVLGMELFREALLTLDPRNDRITVTQGALSADGPGVMPYRADAESGFQIVAKVAGKEVWMNLDTGAPSAFTFPLALNKALPLTGALQDGPTAQLVGGARWLRLGTLDGAIQIGQLNYPNPQIAFMDPSTAYGNIGNAILGDLAISIDQQQGLLALRKSEAAEVTRVVGAQPHGAPRRLGVQFRGMPGGGVLTVARVDPGSLGEGAGIKAGDVLITVNGRPAHEYDVPALGGLIRSGTPLRFELERNGEPHIVEIR